MITDCHVHIQPMELFKPEALALMKKSRKDFDQVAEYCRSPKAFLGYLDRIGVDRAVLINYVAAEVIGFTPAVNEFVARYVKENPKRLIPCGSVPPRRTASRSWSTRGRRFFPVRATSTATRCTWTT